MYTSFFESVQPNDRNKSRRLVTTWLLSVFTYSHITYKLALLKVLLFRVDFSLLRYKVVLNQYLLLSSRVELSPATISLYADT